MLVLHVDVGAACWYRYRRDKAPCRAQRDALSLHRVHVHIVHRITPCTYTHRTRYIMKQCLLHFIIRYIYCKKNGTVP